MDSNRELQDLLEADDVGLDPSDLKTTESHALPPHNNADSIPTSSDVQTVFDATTKKSLSKTEKVSETTDPDSNSSNTENCPPDLYPAITADPSENCNMETPPDLCPDESSSKRGATNGNNETTESTNNLSAISVSQNVSEPAKSVSDSDRACDSSSNDGNENIPIEEVFQKSFDVSSQEASESSETDPLNTLQVAEFCGKTNKDMETSKQIIDTDEIEQTGKTSAISEFCEKTKDSIMTEKPEESEKTNKSVETEVDNTTVGDSSEIETSKSELDVRVEDISGISKLPDSSTEQQTEKRGEEETTNKLDNVENLIVSEEIEPATSDDTNVETIEAAQIKNQTETNQDDSDKVEVSEKNKKNAEEKVDQTPTVNDDVEMIEAHQTEDEEKVTDDKTSIETKAHETDEDKEEDDKDKQSDTVENKGQEPEFSKDVETISNGTDSNQDSEASKDVESELKQKESDIVLLDDKENDDVILVDDLKTPTDDIILLDDLDDIQDNPEFVQLSDLTPNEQDKTEPEMIDSNGIQTESHADNLEQGANEQLCILPDTDRVLSIEEKEAVATMEPLCDPSEVQEDEEAVTIPDERDEKYVVMMMSNSETVSRCIMCDMTRKPKFTTTFEGKTSFLCNATCLNDFKGQHGDKVVLREGAMLTMKNLTGAESTDKTGAAVAKAPLPNSDCAECSKEVVKNVGSLSWETMEFCNEICLSKYLKKLGSNCTRCCKEVNSNFLGKYCVRFGYSIRQFCNFTCLEAYKKGLKVCCYCQKDLFSCANTVVAPVGEKRQLKDFCTQDCMERYDRMTNNKSPVPKMGFTCSVCSEEKPIHIELELKGRLHNFCSEPCFVAFKFVNNSTPGKCDLCRKYVDQQILDENSMISGGTQRNFCSKNCQNIYVVAHRKIMSCTWCRVKKYNFDMIKQNPGGSQASVMVCSLNCLSLIRLSINAANSKKSKCDHCKKLVQPLYHLTMSDATLRNFCSYGCVMAFQTQFSKSPMRISGDPVPSGAPKRTKVQSNVDTTVVPVISSVTSLAPVNGPSTGPRKVKPKQPDTVTVHIPTKTNSITTPVANNISSPPKTIVKQIVVVKPAKIPPQRNIATMCKPYVENRSVEAKPETVDVEVQTDYIKEDPKLIPIPVPIYIPAPMWMYSMPFPAPFPFPLPVPVPVFVPTTRKSSEGIMKEIKKVQAKIPTDPYEADLLMMAEMVAGDKKEPVSESDTDGDDDGGVDDAPSPEPVGNNAFGDDVLQMALKMATEMDGTNQSLPTTENAASANNARPLTATSGKRSKGRKRQRRSSIEDQQNKRQSLNAELQEHVGSEPTEKPDANMCLKYTFGVNAWKQWATTKNAEWERSSQPKKLFKPEILQLTADELNRSLCLFVKEVRKPNGQEYAPDTIYYLCLGIQQYLLENGRIDNIFSDPFYEKFTDCLDEIARRFSVLYNDARYIVTRVEEEHLWECKQLGAHSPQILLSTLMFFNTKHFNLTTLSDHTQLSFSHIMKHWKKNPPAPGAAKGTRSVLLRFYPPAQPSEGEGSRKKVFEQLENEDNPLRCPVKLYEFYLSKCPDSVKSRSDVFYLQPERSCVPDSPVWYSTSRLSEPHVERMLNRVKMVKEINVALLTS